MSEVTTIITTRTRTSASSNTSTSTSTTQRSVHTRIITPPKLQLESSTTNLKPNPIPNPHSSSSSSSSIKGKTKTKAKDIDMSSISTVARKIQKEIKVTKWKCDYCRKAKFDTLKEAEIHEVQCQKDQIIKLQLCGAKLIQINFDDFYLCKSSSSKKNRQNKTNKANVNETWDEGDENSNETKIQEVEVLDILSKLDKLNHVISTEVLQSTEIGKIVAKLKKCKVPAIQTKARALVDNWKSIVGMKSGRSGSSGAKTGKAGMAGKTGKTEKESTPDSKTSRKGTKRCDPVDTDADATETETETKSETTKSRKPPSKKMKKAPVATAPIFQRATKRSTATNSSSTSTTATTVKARPNKKKCTTKNDSKPLASIFTRQSSSTSSTNTSITTCTKSKDNDSTCSQIEPPMQHCITISDYESHASILDGDNSNNSNNSTSTSTSTSNTLLMLDDEKILSEHRKAEFLIKRRKIEEERRTKKKRQQTLLNSNAETCKVKCNAKNKKVEGREIASIFQPISKAESKLSAKVKASAAKRKRPSPSNTGTEVTDDATLQVQDYQRPTSITRQVTHEKSKEEDSVAARLTDLRMSAPRFPVPNYTLSDQNENENVGGESRSQSRLNFFSAEVQNSLICSPRYQCGLDNVSTFDTVGSGSDATSLKFLPDYSKMSFPERTDLLHAYFSSILQPAPIENEVDLTTMPQAWSDKYAMNLIPHDIYGEENKKTATDLLSFIGDWKEHRKQSIIAAEKAHQKRRGKNKKSKPASRKKRYEYDDDFLSDSDAEDSLCKIYVLAGPIGCGKSSLVYAAANKSQCKVLEINTTNERGGTSLKKAIEECTQSHSSLAMLKGKSTLFGNNADLQDTDDEDESSKPSLALILIDEVDLLFESDVGFWPSLLNLSKKAKCPIILTASKEPSQLENNSAGIIYRFGYLTRPSPMECAQKMCLVAKMENMNWQNGFEDHDAIKEGLATIAKVLKCDIRKVLNEMQSYNYGSASKDSKVSFNKLDGGDSNHVPNYTFDYPTVKTISPNRVYSNAPSVVKIKGKNFVSLRKSFGNDISVQVMIGKQKCAPTQIVDDCTILAVCPPCILPSNVNEFGNLKGASFQRALDSAYQNVVVKFSSKKGMICCIDTSLMLSYCFPEEDSDFESESLPKANKEQDISAAELLKNAIEKLKKRGKEDINDDVVITSPPNRDDKGESREIELLAKITNDMSDATLLEDFHRVGQPHLAGAIGSCGEGTIHHFVGCSDTFMTRPASQRDRYLYSNACELARGTASFHGTANSNCPTLNDDEDENDIWFTLENKNSPSEEDLFLPFPATMCSEMIPGLIRRSLKSKFTDFKDFSLDAKSLFLKSERESILHSTQQLVEPILLETNLHCLNRLRNSMESCVALEYVTALRNMAFVERNADEKFAQLMAHPNLEDNYSGRRRTRRGASKPRDHYFESLITYRSNLEPREIGEKLAVNCLLNSYQE